MRLLIHPLWTRNVFSRACYSTAAATNTLAALRKQTGYSIKNCKKALEIHNNDLQQATKWLNEEAQKQGWEKAIKLQNRPTMQGLIGIEVKNRTAALVEVSCETDFVSRNTLFKNLVRSLASACCVPSSQSTREPLSEHSLAQSELTSLKWEDKTLKEHTGLAVAQLGENILLRRGLVLHVTPGIVLCASVHPNTSESVTPLTGTYGAVVALRLSPDCKLNEDAAVAVGRQLCMHIIGMKPKSIKQELEAGKVQNSEDHLKSSESVDDELPEKDFLLGQLYVFNPDATVQDVLLENGLEVVHFVRYERGETADVPT